MSNLLARSLHSVLDGLDTSRVLRVYAVWLIRIWGSLEALVGALMVLGVIAAMADTSAQKPFIGWLLLAIVLVIGAVQAYLQWLLMVRRSREMASVRGSLFTVLPVVARIIRYSAETTCLNIVLLYFAFGLMGLSTAPLAISPPVFGSTYDMMRQSSQSASSIAIGFVVLLAVGLAVTAFSAFTLMLAYGLSAIVEGFEDLVATNRSIADSCKQALGDQTANA